MRALMSHAGGIEIWLPALLVAIVVFIGVRYGGQKDDDPEVEERDPSVEDENRA